MLPPDSEEEPIDIEPAKPRVPRADDRTTAAIAETAKSTEQTAPAIAVPIAKKRPTKPHPLVAKWIADRERRRREATASRDPWRIKMAPALSDIDRRRHAILGTLFRSLEGKGAKISEAERGLLRVTIDGENIDFQIREKNRRVRVSPENRRNFYFQIH